MCFIIHIKERTPLFLTLAQYIVIKKWFSILGHFVIWTFLNRNYDSCPDSVFDQQNWRFVHHNSSVTRISPNEKLIKTLGNVSFMILSVGTWCACCAVVYLLLWASEGKLQVLRTHLVRLRIFAHPFFVSFLRSCNMPCWEFWKTYVLCRAQM